MTETYKMVCFLCNKLLGEIDYKFNGFGICKDCGDKKGVSGSCYVSCPKCKSANTKITYDDGDHCNSDTVYKCLDCGKFFDTRFPESN